VRLLRNQHNLNGANRPFSGDVYSILSRAWTFIFISSFLDPLLSTVVRPIIPPETGYSLGILFTLALIPLLHQSAWQRFLGYLRTLHKRSVSEKASLITCLMLGGAVVASLLKGAVFLSSAKGLIGFFMVLIFIAGLVQAVTKAIRDQQQEQERFARLPAHQIERWEQQLIILSILPFILARLIGLIGVWSAFPTALWWNRVPFFGATTLFLLILQPDKQTFRGLCPRCKQPVPRVLVEMGSCFRCNEALRSSTPEPPKPSR
jgi:hypothetical protein